MGRNKARTARLLEIDRSTLYRKLREMGAEEPPATAR
ncbi:MAG: helix-turn-helix domain-containing protein [Planctomycetota bacterium]